jgi:hypothetical protein
MGTEEVTEEKTVSQESLNEVIAGNGTAFNDFDFDRIFDDQSGKLNQEKKVETDMNCKLA